LIPPLDNNFEGDALMIARRITTSIAITLIGFLIVDFCARAQDVQRPAFYSKPVELKLGRSSQLEEGFYPIGWSRDGKFAYIVEPADEACGCYFAKLVIKDLKTDTVLWDFDYQSTGFGEKDNKPKSLPAFWRSNHALFSKKLTEHKIRQEKGFALQPFPALYQGDELTARLSLERNGQTWLKEAVSAIRLQVNSKRRGKKTVYEKTDVADLMILEVKLLGYLKSQFEPRVALVLIEVHRGYEGPPSVAKINIIGSDLFSGFK
jgi:hypothetical protein